MLLTQIQLLICLMRHNDHAGRALFSGLAFFQNCFRLSTHMMSLPRDTMPPTLIKSTWQHEKQCCFIVHDYHCAQRRCSLLLRSHTTPHICLLSHTHHAPQYIHNLRSTTHIMAMGAPGGYANRVLIYPPEKGSFPLDHFKECQDATTNYQQCLKQNQNLSAPCHTLAKQYLECRMDKGLMAKEDLAHLGFAKRMFFSLAIVS